MHVGVAHLDQGFGGDGAHPPGAALQHDLGVFVLGQGFGGRDLVVGDKQVCASDFTLVGNVGIDKHEVFVV